MNVTITLDNGTEWTLEPTGETDDFGRPCYADIIFDGAVRGMWTVNAVVGLARNLGWDGEISQEDIDASEGMGDVLLADTCTYAEYYLNEIAPSDFSFGWSEGSFYLANEAWWDLDSL